MDINETIGTLLEALACCTPLDWEDKDCEFCPYHDCVGDCHATLCSHVIDVLIKLRTISHSNAIAIDKPTEPQATAHSQAMERSQANAIDKLTQALASSYINIYK